MYTIDKIIKFLINKGHINKINSGAELVQLPGINISEQ